MIADRIKELRLKNDIKQTELAKRLGLSRSAINAWEMGVSVPSTQYLIDLAKLFKVTTDYILGINQEEMIDISSLNEKDKSTIYSLVRHFEQYQYAVDLLYKHDEIMCDDDYEAVGMIRPCANGAVMPESE